MSAGNIAIIGGTGFERLPPDIFAEKIEVETPLGIVSALSISDNYVEPYSLYFLSRHGVDHHLAPHQVDYRANALALSQLGVRHVFATNAVGSLTPDIPSGTLLVVDDFIDFTRSRPVTLYQGPQWAHTDFTVPYSPDLRGVLLSAAEKLGVAAADGGTYVCCDGPRFETPSEVRLFRAWGGDVVGMTGLPEAVFAREAGLGYAALCVVTNLGAGLDEQPVDHAVVSQRMADIAPLLRELTMLAARLLVASWSS